MTEENAARESFETVCVIVDSRSKHEMIPGMKSRGRDVSDLIGTTDYINFKSLGYEGDPIIYGGRFKKLPLGNGENK